MPSERKATEVNSAWTFIVRITGTGIFQKRNVESTSEVHALEGWYEVKFPSPLFTSTSYEMLKLHQFTLKFSQNVDNDKIWISYSMDVLLNLSFVSRPCIVDNLVNMVTRLLSGWSDDRGFWEGCRHFGKGAGILGRVQAFWEGCRHFGKGAGIFSDYQFQNGYGGSLGRLFRQKVGILGALSFRAMWPARDANHLSTYAFNFKKV